MIGFIHKTHLAFTVPGIHAGQYISAGAFEAAAQVAERNGQFALAATLYSKAAACALGTGRKARCEISAIRSNQMKGSE
jgi:hypothetical protein